MFRRIALVSAIALLGVVTSASAQDATMEPTAEAIRSSGNQAVIDVSEKITTRPTITLDRVVLPSDGWVVVNAVVDGKMDATVGFTRLPAGEHSDVSVDVDLVEATPQLIATIHEDNGQTGVYEYDSNPQNDPPFRVNGKLVSATFKFTALNVWNQRDTNNAINIGSVVSDQPTWVVIQADDNGKPGSLLGSAQLQPGASVMMVVPVKGDSTGLVWAVLYPNDRSSGTFSLQGQTPLMDEKGNPVQAGIKIEDKAKIMTADGLDIANPTEPTMEVHDQDVGGDGTTGTLKIPRVTAPVDGWVEVHADQGGRPGVGLGWTHLSQGDNPNVTVKLDANKVPSAPQGSLPPTVWVMVHVDSGTPGDFDHDKVPGADEPVVVDGMTLMQRIKITSGGGQGSTTGSASPEATPSP